MRPMRHEEGMEELPARPLVRMDDCTAAKEAVLQPWGECPGNGAISAQGSRRHFRAWGAESANQQGCSEGRWVLEMDGTVLGAEADSC